MSGKRALSLVGPDDAPTELPQTTDLSVSEAAATGDQRTLLLALRKRTAEAVADPSCPPRDLAALTRRLQEIAKELTALDAAAAKEADVSRRTTAPEAWDESAI